MDDSFFVYLKQLELMAFFSGYPLIYLIILFIPPNRQAKDNLRNRIVLLLPTAYALVGTLFLGFELKNLYPDYSIENIKQAMLNPGLIIWGLLSILFWIPAFNKRKILSLFHSLVFVFFIVKDLFLLLYRSSPDKSFIKNDINVFYNSLLFNLGVLALVVLISFIFARFKKR